MPVFTTYCLGVFHPNKIHRQWTVSEHERRSTDVVRISLAESISLSWIFVVLHGILQVLFLDIVVSEISILDKLPFAEFHQFFLPSTTFSAQSFYLYFLSLQVIFFPLWAFVSSKYWIFVLQAVNEILNQEQADPYAADDIVSLSFSSYLFRFIPILGEPLQGLWRTLILFMGIRTRFQISWFFTFVIFLLPYLIIASLGLGLFFGLALLPVFFLAL